MLLAWLVAAAAIMPCCSTERVVKKRMANQVFEGEFISDSSNVLDGASAGMENYVMNSGDGSSCDGWPTIGEWVSFQTMWTANTPTMQESCSNLWPGVPNDTADEIANIYTGIQQAANASNVDHRFILAVIMQESQGCVRVNVTNYGVRNPGLMQDHDGAHTCNDNNAVTDPCPQDTIWGMIDDAVGGTAAGDGLAGCLSQAAAGGDGSDDEEEEAQIYYQAARLYNSGSIADNSELNDGAPATNCYVSDIANRLTGWVGETGCDLDRKHSELV